MTLDLRKWIDHGNRELARLGRGAVDLFAQLLEQDDQLVRRGFPPLSPFWIDVLKRFYAQGKRRLVLRVGRRGGKSSTLCRVAVCEALHGSHRIPPGDLGVFAFFSVSMREARGRLQTIIEILDVLGIRYERRGDEVRIGHLPVAIRVYPASARTAVGFTCIGAVFDELARWRDDATGANPASDVLDSVRPAMATQGAAHEFLCSSPWSTIDAHYDAMEAGETPDQCTATAPTWVAHPALNEARCAVLEPDEQTRAREYGAIPMPTSDAAFFDIREIDAATRDYSLPRQAEPGEHVTAGADFAFRRDSAGLVIMHRDSDTVWRVADLCELRPSPDCALRPSAVVSEFADRCKVHGLQYLMADAHYRESIVEHLSGTGLGFVSAPLDVPATYTRFRVLLHEGRVRLPRHKQLLRDLAEVKSAPTATGRTRIILPRHPGGGHADLVSALVLAAWQRGGAVARQEKTRDEERREIEQRAYAQWSADELADVKRLQRELRRGNKRRPRRGQTVARVL